MSQYIMSIDQGTTGTTVSIISSKGNSVIKVNKEFPQIFPKAGWVEHNPEDIWKTVVYGIKSALKKANIKGSKIAAIGMTNQRETTVVWDKNSGRPLYNAIVWQCRRTTPICVKLKNQGLEKMVRQKTGLVLDPYFSATKFQWILDNVKGARSRARSGSVLAGTIDTYLLWKLTDGQSHKTDVSNASRTSLMNLKTCNWDKDLLKLFHVPENILPEITHSSGVFGHTSGIPELPDGIPISGIAGDQQAALFGQTCFKAGEAKCTFGTGSFILMNTGEELVRSKNGLLTTVGWQLSGSNSSVQYALEGGAFICGAAVQWLRDGMGFVKRSSEIEALAKQVDDTDGVEFVPALTGLGAPYWQPDARGVITGLTRGTTRAHLALATLEAMALQNVDILNVMQQELGKKMRHLQVDGGAAANNLLMQKQADYLGVRIRRPKMIETTAAGAAYLAGLGVGFWNGQSEIKKVWQLEREFKNGMTQKQREKRLEHWHQAVHKSY